ncbi:hypothetical protein V5799_003187 [Amblyomma americanum]|uniref:Major facilitator superfamily (MFS) profile domain-containing protein n=1 Tax=Amblyomma americanum TaxID=6943 RepID=A0AAQ4D9P2_AMBAM
MPEDLPMSPQDDQQETEAPSALASAAVTSSVVSPSVLHPNIPNQEEELPHATNSASAAPTSVNSTAEVVSAPIHPHKRNLEETTSRLSRRRRSHGRPPVLPTLSIPQEALPVDRSTSAEPAAVTTPAVVVPPPSNQNIRNIETDTKTPQVFRSLRDRPEVTHTSSLSLEGHQEFESSTVAPLTVTASAEAVVAPLHPNTSNLEETRISQVSRGQPADLPTSPWSGEVPQGADSTTAVPATATAPAVAGEAPLNPDIGNLEDARLSQVACGPRAILPSSSKTSKVPQEGDATTTAPAIVNTPPVVMHSPLLQNMRNFEEEPRQSRISRKRRSSARTEALPISPSSPEGAFGADTTTAATHTATTCTVGAPPPFRPKIPHFEERTVPRMSDVSQVSRSKHPCGQNENLALSSMSPQGTQGADVTPSAPATVTESAAVASPPLHPYTEAETRATLTRSKRSSGRPAVLPNSLLSPLSPLPPLSVLSPCMNAREVGATTIGLGTTNTTSAPPLDHILIFGHGRFQRLILLCASLAFFVSLLHTAALASLARPVNHWCRPPVEYARLPAQTWKNSSVPLEADGKGHSQCLRYDPPIPVAEDAYIDNRSVVPCDNGWDYEVGLSAGLGVQSIVQEWDIVCGRRWMLSVLSALNLLGGVIGAPIAGVTADIMGRRPVLVIWVILLIFTGTAVVFADTMLLFTVLRTLLSAAAISVFVTSAVVLFEVTNTQHRTSFCSVAIVGAICLATAYHQFVYNFSLTWQASQIAYMIPSCGLILAVYLVEESPCWLLAVSEVHRAETVLSWAAHVNKIDPESFKQRLGTLKMELKRQPQTHTDPWVPNIFSPEQGAYLLF